MSSSNQALGRRHLHRSRPNFAENVCSPAADLAAPARVPARCDDGNNEFRRLYRAFRTGAAKGAKGEGAVRAKIPSGGTLARSSIFAHDPTADAIRARFEWARACGHLLVEGSAIRADEDGASGTRSSSRIGIFAALALVCGSCCQLCVEVLLKHDGRMGNLISATEYTYCAVLSSGSLRLPRRLPRRCHLWLWLAGVAHSALTNAGLATRGLPMPVALVIKNGSLLANILVGSVVGKRPSCRQLVAATLISVGLLLGTLGSSGGVADDDESDGAPYALGVVCLGGALLARASSAILQERIFDEHGVAHDEVLFWRATLGAPVFLVSYLRGGGGSGSGSSSVLSDILESPRLSCLLAANVVADHICKVAVSRLIGEAGSLVATVVICAQRFTSCVFSAFLAPQSPPPSLWLAIAAVAVGSLASIPSPKETPTAKLHSPKKEE
uniref:Sugar phosphate transporter domain-containing protein n=1 Tax=Calcidiscus leptoporus TaxID=127549 RepID=A0A7S0JHH7_9EUKA